MQASKKLSPAIRIVIAVAAIPGLVIVAIGLATLYFDGYAGEFEFFSLSYGALSTYLAYVSIVGKAPGFMDRR